MEATKWKPTGEEVGKVRFELSRTIRTNLPAIELLRRSNFGFGALSDANVCLDTSVLPVQIKTLRWRVLEFIDWQNRAATAGVFSGQAWVHRDLIDFSGDDVRDLATGAFLEFQLLTMGLR